MQIRLRYKLTSVIAAIGFFGLVACNSDSNSGSAGTADSSMKTAATDSTAKDSTAMVAKTSKKRRKASAIIPASGTDKMVKDKEGVYNRAEKMPEYPGGQDALSAYINDHLNDSQTSMDDNSTGKVRVSFVVDEKGKVMDVHILGDQKSGNGLDQEVVRVISNMPAWTPGRVKGKTVKTRLELPISFESES